MLRIVNYVAFTAIVSLSSLPAARADLVFNLQGDFLAAAGSVMTETFESQPNIGTPGAGAQTMIDFDDFSATSARPALKIFDSPMVGNFNTTPNGAKYLAVDTDVGNTGTTVTLTFQQSLRTFGLFLIDLEEDYTILINGMTYTVLATGNETSTFFGIITDVPFNNVGISSEFETDSFSSFDDVSFGVVPEPSSLLMFGIGMGVLLTQRRKDTPDVT